MLFRSVRILASTNRNLEGWVEEGKFRQDLFYRLNVIPLRLPSLKERGDDIFELAHFFTQLYTKEYGLPQAPFSAEAIEWMREYGWPGNVRELQNIMERAVLLSGGNPITPAHFLLEDQDWPLFEEEVSTATDNDAVQALAEPETEEEALFSQGVIPLHEMERIMITKGLEQTGGNRTQTADLLGISVRTLRNKLNEYREAGFEIV